MRALSCSSSLERAGRRDLIRRISGDLGEAARRADDAPAGDWQPTPLPFYDGEELRELWMFTRQQREDRPDADGGEDATRFVIELDLSRMGRLQLDGLVHGDRFDLILRSATPLPRQARQDLSAMMADALGATGMEGGLVFESGKFPDSPLRDLEQWNAAARGDVSA